MLHGKFHSCAVFFGVAFSLRAGWADEQPQHKIRHVVYQVQYSSQDPHKLTVISPMDVVSASFWAFQNINTKIVAEAEIDESTCTVVSDGIWAASVAPQYGTWTSSIVDMTIPACPNSNFTVKCCLLYMD
jgi:hypothetical protein